MDIAIRRFQPAHVEKLHQAFVAAFADYFVDFQPSIAQFKRRMFGKLNIDSAQSLVAWHGDHIIGFALHTVNDFEGKKTLYNGGTGVLPAYRRQHIATRLLEKSLEKPEPTAERVLLEVVTQNDAALRLYESMSFRSNGLLKCFKLRRLIEDEKRHPVIMTQGLKNSYEYHFSFSPRFLDSTRQLQHNLQNETVLEARKEGKPLAHLVFQHRLGRISQLAVHPDHRNQGLAKALLANAQKLSDVSELTIMNIPEQQTETIDALIALGFNNELNQIEMEMTL